MSWGHAELWAKAKLYAEKLSFTPIDDPEFGLRCSFVLEILVRASLAKVSPTLLANTEKDQASILYALGRESEKSKKSIDISTALDLCTKIFPGFTKEMYVWSMALVNQRNEELHSGSMAFVQYSPDKWLANFYRCCKVLCECMEYSLSELIGDDHESRAIKIMDGNRNDVKQKVITRIAQHKSVFERKPNSDRVKIHQENNNEADKLAYKGFHRVECPSCFGTALVQGDKYGKEMVSHDDDEIVIKIPMLPSKFECRSCELRMDGYIELECCGLGKPYTRTTRYSAAEYFGLIHPDDLSEHVEEYINNMREYDNE